MLLSFVIPVYNRPEEMAELLASLSAQTCRDFEVVVAEDGSAVTSEYVAARFAADLPLCYLNKPNSGPGLTRNFGAAHSRGDYLIFLDSDCILPPGYVAEVLRELNERPADAFGGPDRADDSFTPVQKAINYAMTSFFTTGGIRGGRRKMDRFYPRSFNMGVRRDVFEALGGFASLRFGEDIDLSTRIFDAGYSCRLFPEAWVFHKRRTDFRKFFRQVHNFGIARVAMWRRYPATLKTVHLLPALFTLGCAAILLAAVWYPVLLGLPLLFALAVWTDAGVRTRSLKIGMLAVCAAFVQLLGYGSGFLVAWWRVCVLRRQERFAFENNFYK